jgi:hypothetical protein
MAKSGLAALPLALLLGACASLVSSGPETLAIEGEGTYRLFDEERRLVSTGVLPTEVALDTSAGFFDGMDYTVQFHQNGVADRETEVETEVSLWYSVGNLFSFNILGWLLVDPYTGAMWTLERDRIAAPAQ